MLSPNTLLHIIQRDNNRHQCYLAWLAEYARATGCETHSYVLMTHHFSPLVGATHAGDPGNLMKRLGQRYVQYIIRSYQRSGTLPLLSDPRSRLVLGCYCDIELNPGRAGMVEHPADDHWSSYRVNAQGEVSPQTRPPARERHPVHADSPQSAPIKAPPASALAAPAVSPAPRG